METDFEPRIDLTPSPALRRRLENQTESHPKLIGSPEALRKRLRPLSFVDTIQEIPTPHLQVESRPETDSDLDELLEELSEWDLPAPEVDDLRADCEKLRSEKARLKAEFLSTNEEGPNQDQPEIEEDLAGNVVFLIGDQEDTFELTGSDDYLAGTVDFQTGSEDFQTGSCCDFEAFDKGREIDESEEDSLLLVIQTSEKDENDSTGSSDSAQSGNGSEHSSLTGSSQTLRCTDSGSSDSNPEIEKEREFLEELGRGLSLSEGEESHQQGRGWSALRRMKKNLKMSLWESKVPVRKYTKLIDKVNMISFCLF